MAGLYLVGVVHDRGWNPNRADVCGGMLFSPLEEETLFVLSLFFLWAVKALKAFAFLLFSGAEKDPKALVVIQ